MRRRLVATIPMALRIIVTGSSNANFPAEEEMMVRVAGKTQEVAAEQRVAQATLKAATCSTPV